MEKDVLISIRGLQYLMDEESGEQEPVEVMTTGSYYKKNGHHFLIYDEATEGFDMMTHNMIKFTENALEVRKRGLIDVHMIFEEDKKNISFYHTPYGMINMGVAATKVRMKETPPELKLGKDHKLAEYIEHKIADEQYSPAAVLGRIKAKGLKFNTTISVNTLYSYIDKGVFLRITNKDLPVKGSRKREYRHTKAQSRAPKGESIEKRPEEINNRETFGHWEMDCVESAKGCTTTLLVLTERLSRREITRRMEAKKAENVVAELDALEKRYGELFPLIFKSITVDNGSEFANCEGMERSSLREGEKRTKLYYCHPYSAYERGSNENQNKLVRRHAPKGSSFEDMTDERADYIEGWMNDYPRKMFNWHTPEEVFQTEIKALSGAL